MYASDYRRIARDRLTGNWGISIGIAVVACLLGGLITGTSFLPEINQNQESYLYTAESMDGLFRIRIGSGSILALPQLILGGVLELGYGLFLLKQHDGQQTQFGDLFSQFERFGAGFLQAFLRGLFTFLWSLLLIIPGIVAAYRYAMTPFIMIEHPDLTPMEAIEASKQLMDGHKWELFCLDFSFIGWDILCILTLNLGHIALNPYKNAARAAFYRSISTSRCI
ncbi:MAG: DUF975 family protein [Oscillospiraceae bacterium]|nr:DUF975 family protein [Oscillospiraceae bacterium]